MSCDSSDLIYVIIPSNCMEDYIGETGINETKLRDRVGVYRQHIHQPQYQQLKVISEHLQVVISRYFPSFKCVLKENF